MTRLVLVEDRGKYVLIQLNRPEKLNALNEEMWLGVRDAIIEYGSVKPLVLTGSGKAFSAGDDIYMMAESDGEEGARHIVYDMIKPLLEAIVDAEMPLIAAVNGYAFGAGCEMLLLMDVVVASRDAVFSVPEGKIGLTPPLMLSAGPWNLGLRRTIYLTLTGKWLTAEEAHQYGLVDIVADDPLAEAEKVVESILETPIEAIRRVKRRVNRFKRMLIDEEAFKDLAELMAGETAQKLMKEFIEKRRR